MHVVDHPDGAALLARARELLETNEAENNLQLGICAGLAASPPPAERRPYLATVEEGGIVAAVAVWTPPLNLVLSRAPVEALGALVSELRARDVSLPGVLAPDETAESFAELWSQQGGGPWRVTIRERIYQLTSVSPPAHPVSGRIREAALSDRDVLVRWVRGFSTESGLDPMSEVAALREVQRRIEQRTLFVWEDGELASMAATAGPTARGVRINLVYTPQELRRRGYASACVAVLSQLLLDSGRTFCFLYADRANPTSNGIYQQIGYQKVADVTMITFGA